MPDYEAFMLPLLNAVQSAPLSVDAAADRVAQALSLSDDQQRLKPAWAHEPMVLSRTRVAAESLAAAGLIRRADDTIAIEDRGRALLAERPEALNREALRRYPEFETYLQAYLARQGA